MTIYLKAKLKKMLMYKKQFGDIKYQRRHRHILNLLNSCKNTKQLFLRIKRAARLH